MDVAGLRHEAGESPDLMHRPHADTGICVGCGHRTAWWSVTHECFVHHGMCVASLRQDPDEDLSHPPRRRTWQ